MDTSEFNNFVAEDFRAAQRSYQREIDDLQVRRLQLMKEKRIVETVMYMMFPKEAVRDGYLSATTAISQRLRHAKDSREAKKKPAGRKSDGALEDLEMARDARIMNTPEMLASVQQ